jgi:hypothetical protein
MILKAEGQNTWTETCPSDTLSTKSTTRIGLRSNQINGSLVQVINDYVQLQDRDAW